MIDTWLGGDLFFDMNTLMSVFGLFFLSLRQVFSERYFTLKYALVFLVWVFLLPMLTVFFSRPEKLMQCCEYQQGQEFMVYLELVERAAIVYFLILLPGMLILYGFTKFLERFQPDDMSD